MSSGSSKRASGGAHVPVFYGLISFTFYPTWLGISRVDEENTGGWMHGKGGKGVKDMKVEIRGWQD